MNWRHGPTLTSFSFVCGKHTLEGVQARLDAMTKAINTFSLYTNIHHYLTLQEGACLIDDPELNIVILQARARGCLQPSNTTRHLFVL